METISASLGSLWGDIHPSPVDSPHKGPVLRSIEIFFGVNLNNYWTHSRVLGDLRRNDAQVTYTGTYHGPLTRYVKLLVAHAPGMPGTFPPATDFKGNRWLATPACITARASRTCRDACRDLLPAVAGKTFPAFPAHAHPPFYVSGKGPMANLFRCVTPWVMQRSAFVVDLVCVCIYVWQSTSPC